MPGWGTGPGWAIPGCVVIAAGEPGCGPGLGRPPALGTVVSWLWCPGSGETVLPRPEELPVAVGWLIAGCAARWYSAITGPV